ncbi:MAG: MotE family protein [Bdellovibrionales bacterium]
MRIPPRFLLPLLIIVGVGTAGFRVNNAWHTFETGALLSPINPAHAKEAEDNKHQEAPQETTAQQATPEASQETPPVEETENTPETKLYKQLAGRRDQLEERAKQLDAREAIVAVAERRIDQKMEEMRVLQKQLKSLLGQASSEQTAQLENLVKIYETMKPKEAARIFENLDMKILLHVVQRMKPKSTAAILASMDPLKAKAITVALTKRDQLPAAQ